MKVNLEKEKAKIDRKTNLAFDKVDNFIENRELDREYREIGWEIIAMGRLIALSKLAFENGDLEEGQENLRLARLGKDCVEDLIIEKRTRLVNRHISTYKDYRYSEKARKIYGIAEKQFSKYLCGGEK